MALKINKPKTKEVFTRKEYKYFVPGYLLNSTINYFSNFLEVDPFNKRTEPYIVRSVYFDSQTFKHYFEKIHGNYMRKKIRLRTYGVKENNYPIFLEVKNKRGDMIFKERVILDTIDVDFWKTFNFSYFSSYKSNVVNECIADQKLYGISPKIMVLYHRLAFLDNSIRFKINMDFNLSYKLTSDIFFSESDTKPLTKNNFILELKYDKIIPYYFMNFIASNNLKRIPFSKYTNSLERGFNQ